MGIPDPMVLWWGRRKGRLRPDKRAERRAYGISAYVGSNGGGKTAAMVWDTLPSLEAGRPVLSTVRFLDYENPRECADVTCEADPKSGHFKTRPTDLGREAEIQNARLLHAFGEDAELLPVETEVYGIHRAAHPLWVPWTRWDQLVSFRFGDVCADEITGVASSRESVSLPFQVVNHFQQMRRADIPFRYTAPAWDRADKSLREPTQTVTECSGLMATEATDGAGQRTWKPRRLFQWVTYDAKSLSKWTDGKGDQLEPEVVDWHYGPDSPAFSAYDTFDSVLQIGQVTESGRCYRCGGTRRAPACRCGSDHGAGGEAPRRGPEGVPGRGSAPRVGVSVHSGRTVSPTG